MLIIRRYCDGLLDLLFHVFDFANPIFYEYFFFESVADLQELCFFTDEMATLVLSDRQF